MKAWFLLLTVGLLLVGGAVALAEEGPTRHELLSMIEALKKRNALLEQRLAALEARVAHGAGPELSREQVRALVEKMLAEARDTMTPGWMEDLTFFGDFRLRYEFRRFAESAGGRNDDEGRARYRLRVGVRKRWPEEDLEVGFRIASGDITAQNLNQTSTNETMGDFFTRDEFRIDRAYARWTPKTIPGLLVTGGRIAQPWITTDLVWDTDVNPEGVWVQYDVRGLESIRPFVAAGAFFLSSNNPGDDAHMNVWSAGYDWHLGKDVTWTQAFTFYETSHYQAGLAAGEEWDFLNLTNAWRFQAGRLPMEAYIDWVHNCGANRETPDEQNDGLAFGIKAGTNKKKGDLSLRYVYKYIQLEASPRAFNDGDFGDGRKGHVVGVRYNLTDYMQAAATLYLTKPIYDPDPDGQRVRFQTDLIWKF